MLHSFNNPPQISHQLGVASLVASYVDKSVFAQVRIGVADSKGLLPGWPGGREVYRAKDGAVVIGSISL